MPPALGCHADPPSPSLPRDLQVHMLLLAHLSREDIPPSLLKDLHFVVTKCPGMLQEMMGIAAIPRTPVRLCAVLCCAVWRQLAGGVRGLAG